MVSETADEGRDDLHPDDDENAPSLTNYERRPEHQQGLAEVFQMDSDELLRRLSIGQYDQPGFIPAEILVALARGRFGSARVRNEVALALLRCVLVELRHFLNRNLQWYGVTSRNSEWQREAVSDVQVAIFESKAEVSFAEVTFRTFVDRRLRDWFKSQVRLKNKMPSVDALAPADDEDGNKLSLTEQVEDDISSGPEAQLARKQLFARCRVAVAELPDRQRTALTLYVLQDMTYKEAGAVMNLDESTVRTHVKLALKALRNGDWHE